MQMKNLKTSKKYQIKIFAMQNKLKTHHMISVESPNVYFFTMYTAITSNTYTLKYHMKWTI